MRGMMSFGTRGVSAMSPRRLGADGFQKIDFAIDQPDGEQGEECKDCVRQNLSPERPAGMRAGVGRSRRG